MVLSYSIIRKIVWHMPFFYGKIDVSYVGFLFLDKNGKPSGTPRWEHYFKRIVEKYNGIYKTPLPEITPHVCRHTYCSNMAKSGMNPKTLQYLMGHADISVTLNTYTHVAYEDIQEEVLKVVKPR